MDIKYPITPVFREIDGTPRTQSLFLELRYEVDKALYTLKRRDHEYNGKVYPSLYVLYMQIGDITEYEFAKACFEDWTHWKRIRENKLITPHADAWAEELEIKLRSEAIRSMRMQARTDKGGASAKWLAERGWADRTMGRPSKDAVAKEAAKQNKIAGMLDADVERMSKDFKLQ